MKIRMETILRQMLLGVIVLMLTFLNSTTVFADSAKEIEQDSKAALETLYASNPEIKKLGQKAKAVLVFPEIKKAGFIVGGQGGEGALLKKGKVTGFFQTAAGSIGLQAGVQEFGLAMFFLDDASLKYLQESDGWEIGSGPSVVIADKGFGKTVTSATIKDGIYAFIFGQKGLMAGIGLQGSKITKITPDK